MALFAGKCKLLLVFFFGRRVKTTQSLGHDLNNKKLQAIDKLFRLIFIGGLSQNAWRYWISTANKAADLM